MMRPTSAWLWCLVVGAALPGCSPPGKPSESDRYERPTEVMDFAALYARYCAGCHGAEGKLGPARPLADPLYLAWAGVDAVRETIADGVPGTSMPAWSEARGGPLTEAQVEALATGLSARWGSPGVLADVRPPPYSEANARAAGSAPGDAARGASAYGTFCGECHGADGRGGKDGGSVVDSAFLGLVSDQMLRSAVVAGRTDLRMPDYRGYRPDRVMSDQEISDVVAWLAAQRPEFPGQPYAEAVGPEKEGE